MLLFVQSRLTYQVEHLTPAWFFLLGAHTEGQHIVFESIETDPPIFLQEGRDAFNNRTLYGLLPPGGFAIKYGAHVQLMPRHPLTVAPERVYLQASRYCCPLQVQGLLTEILRESASEWESAAQICHWVSTHLSYKAGSSTSRSRMIDTLMAGEGVCRDFSHVAVSLCRAAGLPARYVSAYAYQLEPPDFHALFEVFADGHWHLMDATGRCNPLCVVRIGVGRDAGDIPVAEFGETVKCCQVVVKVEAVTPEQSAWTEADSA